MQLMLNMLLENVKSTNDATYNYYLYETQALLICRCANNQAALLQFGNNIQSLMNFIIQEGKQDIIFYAFQIHALFLQLFGSVTDAHKTLMNSLLQLVLFTHSFLVKQYLTLGPKGIGILVETFGTVLHLRLDESAFSLVYTLMHNATIPCSTVSRISKANYVSYTPENTI